MISNPITGLAICGVVLMKSEYNVVVVGAGAAGIGVSVMLKKLGVDFVVLERHEIGASFKRWPEEIRFISPSFNGNPFGVIDLNAITPDTSPSYMFQSEHISGKEYAEYLKKVVKDNRIPVEVGVDVKRVLHKGDAFEIDAAGTTIRSKFVIWAAGEFQYPSDRPFEGAEHCIHSSKVKSFDMLEGDDFIIIGGYESGLDAAIHLSKKGKKSTVLDSEEPWDVISLDPSTSVSPYTKDRLREEMGRGLIRLVGNSKVAKVEKRGKRYVVVTGGGEFESQYRPILANGFRSSLTLIKDLLEVRDHEVVLTDKDESTACPGLFLAGPYIRHGGMVYCFIYKFRNRFQVVAEEVAGRLGIKKKLGEDDVFLSAGEP
jgi:putative flavoprotein involved in K+ transport